MTKLIHSSGAGKKLQDTVHVTIERTLNLLSQHLASKNAQSLAANSRAPAPRSTPLTAQSSAEGVYHQPGTYPPYESSNGNLGSGTQPHMNSQAAAFVQAPSVTTHTTSVTYQNPSQYSYQAQYNSNPTTYEQQPYAQPNTLPATAAAANAYMGSYQQPQEASPAYTSNPAFAATSTYHSPGSPSSWRQFAGDITSNIDPGTDYISSASALIQLGRSEGPSQQQQQQQQQQMSMGMDLQQESNINGGSQQSWPFLLFGSGPGIG